MSISLEASDRGIVEDLAEGIGLGVGPEGVRVEYRDGRIGVAGEPGARMTWHDHSRPILLSLLAQRGPVRTGRRSPRGDYGDDVRALKLDMDP